LFLFMLAVRQQRSFTAAALRRRTLAIYLAAAVLLSVNWLVYVWGVNAGFIVETSLGYFINPLVNVLLGVVFLRERLRPWQWVPVGLAAIGVTYLTLSYGSLPWIALTLAFTFGIYGLVKKVAPLNSLHGLTLETGMLFLPAVAYLIVAEVDGQGKFLHTGLVENLLLVLAGLVTTVPLLLFAGAARRIPLSLMGILQYIAPTLQFVLGVLVYHEVFDQTRAIGFGIVWTALVIFWGEGWLTRRATAAQRLAASPGA
jgi:chloramphenicol-sensitive protein RarD